MSAAQPAERLGTLATAPARRLDRSEAALAGVVLLILSGVFVVLRVERPAFHRAMPFVLLAGTAVNALLPPRGRRLLLLGLSIAAFVLVLGAPNALAVVVGSALLGGICLAPIPFRVRLALLAAAVVGLFVLRAFPVPGAALPPAAWPALFSVVMFRAFLLLYHQRYAREKLDSLGAFQYLLLLPNAFFLLFPVVDPAAFARARVAPLGETVSRGALRLTRGVFCFLLYRLASTLMVPDAQVRDAGGLFVHLLAGYLLILHVFAQFDFSIGLLQLFGLDLPEINRRSFEPAGATDFWRRNNLYWRELMQKLVLNPVYFRLRKGGGGRALATGVAASFVATWLLHAYQRYGLVGRWGFSWPDTLFWLAFGTLVLAQLLRERRRAAEATAPGREPAWRKVLAIGGTLAVVTFLWSLWMSPSVGAWLRLLRAGLVPPARLGPVLGALGILALAILVSRIPLEPAAPGGPRVADRRRSLALAAALLLSVLIATTAAPWKVIGLGRPRPLDVLRAPSMSRRDADNLQKGYYEEIMAVDVFTGELGRLLANESRVEPFVTSAAARPTRDVRRYELRPNVSMMVRGALLHTSSAGLRDREFAATPPPGTTRVALLGGSHVMGLGVADEDVFERKVEDRLVLPGGGRVEILNFAFVGYGPVEQLWLLENRVFETRPKAVLLVDSSRGPGQIQETLRRFSGDGSFPFAELAAESGDPAADRAGALDRGYHWVLRRFAADCRSRGIAATWIFLDVPGGGRDPVARQRQIDAAREAGFATLDLADVYGAFTRRGLTVSDLDAHPNARAHALVADRLLSLLSTRPELLGLSR